MKFSLCCLLPLALSAALNAQVNLGSTNPQPGAPSGTVTGTVYAQDTQRPVRFAEVELMPFGDNGRRAGPRVRSELDGTFTALVTPGDYYVTAAATGYIGERSLLLAKITAGADPVQLLGTIPVAHVSAGGSTSVTVNVERGAAIAGRLQWEDGSPAAGQSVSANNPSLHSQQLPAPLPQLPQFSNSAYATTDDRGNFRISGLPAGDYVLASTVRGPMQMGIFTGRGRQQDSSVTFYAPAALHSSEAQVFTLRAGDDRTDARFTLDLRSLRTVSGTATSANPGVNVASGNIQLTDTNDPTLHAQATIDRDGSFEIRYVPQGTYTLQVTGASSRPFGPGNRSATPSPATSFQSFSQTITVTDSGLTNLNLSLTPIQSH